MITGTRDKSHKKDRIPQPMRRLVIIGNEKPGACMPEMRRIKPFGLALVYGLTAVEV